MSPKTSLKQRYLQLKNALSSSFNRFSGFLSKTSQHILSNYLRPFLAWSARRAVQFKAQLLIFARKIAVLSARFLQYAKIKSRIAANNSKIVANGLFALAKVNFYLLYQLTKRLLAFLLLISQVVFALFQMTVFLLWLNLKRLLSKTISATKSFLIAAKAALLSFIRGTILFIRVLFALTEVSLCILLIHLKTLFGIIKRLIIAFFIFVKKALILAWAGLLSFIRGTILFIRVLFALARFALCLFFIYVRALLHLLNIAAKAFYAAIKAALRLLFKYTKILLGQIKAAAIAFYTFLRAAFSALIKATKALLAKIWATLDASFTCCRTAHYFLSKYGRLFFWKTVAGFKAFLVSVESGLRSLLRVLVAAIKRGLSGIGNFFGAIRKKTASRIDHFILRQKLRLLKARLYVQHSPRFQKLKQYALLIRLDKPIGILLLLWPTLIALWVAAGGWPDTDVLIVFVAGVFLMRSAGCAINDYADRDIDIKVARTKNRPLTSGKISEKETLIIFAVLSFCAFILVLFMNTLTILMSLVGLALAASYPFMKRHTYFPQVHLGAAFGWAVPMAYTAQTGEVSAVTWLLFIATVLWATAYDTMYAMVDREDDLKIGVKSTAILFESSDRLIIGIIQALLILCLILVGTNLELGGFYYTGLILATGLALWQQLLIRYRRPAMCFRAFLNNNWFGFVLFLGVFLEYQIGGITS